MAISDLAEYQVVILCGGQGTRIKGVSESLPKPLIDVGGKPILWHIMKTYSTYGIKKFVLCLGYKGETIIDYFANYHKRNHDFTMKISSSPFTRNLNPQGPGERSDLNKMSPATDADVDEWEITFALTGENTMTGGRIKRIEKYITEDLFFCTYGDGVSDVDISALLAFHKKKCKTATLTGVHLPTTFGIVEADAEDMVTSFREKPVMSGLINGGFFVFNRGIFDIITGDDCVLEEMPFKRLARSSQLGMFKHEGFWHCMDTYKDYMALNAMWNDKKAPWKIW